MMRNPKTWLAIGAVVLGAAAGVAFLNDGAAKSAPPPVANLKTPYVAVSEGKMDVEGGIIQVASRAAGVVEQVYVLEGDAVKKGQVLAIQESETPRLKLRSAEARLERARSRTQALQVDLNRAEREYERLARLPNFVAVQQIERANDAVAAARAALAEQASEIAVARAEVDELRQGVEETIIRAPIDGRIVRRYANPGVGVSTLNITPMFDLEPGTGRIVRAELTEAQLGRIRVGQAAEILAESDQSEIYHGKILRRAAIFGARKLQSDDPGRRTDERVAEVILSADQAPFLAGQRVLVRFLGDAPPTSAASNKAYSTNSPTASSPTGEATSAR